MFPIIKLLPVISQSVLLISNCFMVSHNSIMEHELLKSYLAQRLYKQPVWKQKIFKLSNFIPLFQSCTTTATLRKDFQTISSLICPILTVTETPTKKPFLFLRLRKYQQRNPFD